MVVAETAKKELCVSEGIKHLERTSCYLMFEMKVEIVSDMWL